ncbi:MAG: 4Fe-4S binding protein [Dehalococcoidia bacterium]|nr:4Fe-4S binding protein [Dehalococcoidia bacterium]MDZ4246848.1 4Fe-4S binding protein [Dehalococcoidia bacterium]
MGVQKINPELCNGCGICVEDCPVDALRMNQDDKAFIAYTLDCAVCFQCSTNCPVEAVTVNSMAPRELILPY